jgi:ubiquinone/menaquinone biosynthesis C-methylase UbiE
MTKLPSLKMLPMNQYRGVNDFDPIRYYYWPIIGRMYRRRVELALAECTGGARVLEAGFGTGLAFLNLCDMYAEIHGVDLTADVVEVSSVYTELGVRTFLKQGDLLALPYEDGYFDTVLLVSILEHLKPHDLATAFSEIHRVLKPGGQMVYGTPVERPFMVFMFGLLGHSIRREHFSTEKEIAASAGRTFSMKRIIRMKSRPPILGAVYEIGHFTK